MSKNIVKPNTTDGIKFINDSIVISVINYLNSKENKHLIALDSYMKAINIVSNITETNPKVLFDYYINTIRNFLIESAAKMKKESGDKLIETFINEYDQSKILIYWMRNIFISLDSFYTRTSSIGSLFLNGMKLCNSELYVNPKTHLFETLNIMIEKDRKNKIIDRSKIKKLFRILEEIDMTKPELKKNPDQTLMWIGEKSKSALKDWFEKQFKKDTEQFVIEIASEYMSLNSTIDFIKSALKYLSEENIRKDDYISREFHQDLDHINYKLLIAVNSVEIVKMDSGIKNMLLNEKLEDLLLVYNLFSLVPESLKTIASEVESFIKLKGEELYTNKELSKETLKFVPELIKFKLKIDNLVEFSFPNSILFQDTKNKAFVSFMSKEIYAKHLVNFSDYEMVSGIKGNTDQQIEDKLNNIVNLFRCINNKLVFQIEYSKKLAERLLKGRSQSIISEKNLITKLKAESGVAYVNKMTSMLQDLDSSKLEMELYRKTKSKGTPLGISLNIQVLQNSWDIDKSKFDRIIIPNFLQGCLNDFNSFYTERHKNHVLTWVYGLSDLEVQFLNLKKQYKSKSTLCQYLILFYLEKKGKLKIYQIAEIIGLKEDQVANEATFLLYHPQFNPKKVKNLGIILSDVNDQRDLEPNDNIWINDNFSFNSLILSTIPTKQRKTQGEDQEKEQNEIQNLKIHRNCIIDATITRIMKGRIGQKTPHAFLIAEVSKQIDLFTAQPPQIRERTEALIEKQILKRKEDDIGCYEYVA